MPLRTQRDFDRGGAVLGALIALTGIFLEVALYPRLRDRSPYIAAAITVLIVLAVFGPYEHLRTTRIPPTDMPPTDATLHSVMLRVFLLGVIVLALGAIRIALTRLGEPGY